MCMGVMYGVCVCVVVDVVCVSSVAPAGGQEPCEQASWYL